MTQFRKCLINCLSARSGGAVSYLSNAVRRILSLDKAGVNASFRVLCDDNQAKAIALDGSQVLVAPTTECNAVHRSLWERRELPRIVREHDISVVFTPYQVSSNTASAKSVLMLRNMEPFFFGNYQYSLKTKLRNYILRHLTCKSIGKADHIIAVSGFVRSYLVDNMSIDPARITQIYHGRDHYFSEPSEPDRDADALQELQIDMPFVLTCGSLLPYRRCEDVIAAFVAFQEDRDQRYCLAIAGDSNDERYKRKLFRLAEESGIRNQLKFVGHIPKSHMSVLYRRAEMVVLATEIEACPNIAIEAMSAGALIISADSAPLREVIGLPNALFYQRRSVLGLQKLMLQAIENSEASAVLRQRARLHANSYSWEQCAVQTARLIGQI